MTPFAPGRGLGVRSCADHGRVRYGTGRSTKDIGSSRTTHQGRSGAAGPRAVAGRAGGAPAGSRTVPNRTEPRRGLRGPRHARHTSAAGHLGALSLPVGYDGVITGTDTEGHPQMTVFHRPAPYDVPLIGGLWTARVPARVRRTTGHGWRWRPGAPMRGRPWRRPRVPVSPSMARAGFRRPERPWAARWWYGTADAPAPWPGGALALGGGRRAPLSDDEYDGRGDRAARHRSPDGPTGERPGTGLAGTGLAGGWVGLTG